MALIHVDKVYTIDSGEIRSAIAAFESRITVALRLQRDELMHTIQEISDKLDTIKQEAADYKAARDAIDVQKDADLAAAVAQHVTDQATLDALQPAIDAAVAKADDAIAALATPGTTPPADPPVDVPA